MDLLNGMKNEYAETLENGDLKDGDNVAKLLKASIGEHIRTNFKSTKTKNSNIPTNKEVVSKAGTVEVTNEFDKIMSYKEFILLSDTNKINTLKEYRERHTAEEISTEWKKGISIKNAEIDMNSQKIYTLYSKYIKGVPRMNKGYKKNS